MTKIDRGVSLRAGKSASTVFYEVLTRSAEKYGAWSDLQWPSQAQFRQGYVDFLPKFEARRLASPQRYDIANDLAKDTLDDLVLDGVAIPDALAQPGNALPLETIKGVKSSHWQPTFDYDGVGWTDFASLGERLYEQRFVSHGALASLEWLQANALASGELNLTNRKICVLGAGAEMAATRQFLQAGAHVLWLDLKPPGADFSNASEFSGTLTYPPGGADLLNDPVTVRATIEAFAAGQPVDLCLYAYAPGQARELRLTGVMCGLVNALPGEVVGNVTMLVSPTTPSALDEMDLERMQARLDSRPGWESVLAMFGLLGRGFGAEQFGSGAVIRSVVSIQGASYQAAQYLCKVIMADVWHHRGRPGDSEPGPFRVSANTAAITQTRSLVHPVFDAAFGGAAALQVKTFTPEQSQCLGGMLAVSDWLQDKPPVPGSVRVHGGIHTLPYPLEAALKPAAGIGFARSPSLLLGLMGGGK